MGVQFRARSSRRRSLWFQTRPGLVTQAGTLVTGQTIFTYTTDGPSILMAIPIQDSTDKGFRGLVSVRTALAGPLNIPAVRP